MHSSSHTHTPNILTKTTLTNNEIHLGMHRTDVRDDQSHEVYSLAVNKTAEGHNLKKCNAGKCGVVRQIVCFKGNSHTAGLSSTEAGAAFQLKAHPEVTQ